MTVGRRRGAAAESLGPILPGLADETRRRRTTAAEKIMRPGRVVDGGDWTRAIAASVNPAMTPVRGLSGLICSVSSRCRRRRRRRTTSA